MSTGIQPEGKKKARGRKRRRKPRQEPVYYIVQIEAWDWSFSFGVNWSKHFSDPYMDFRHLLFTGRLLHPKAIKAEKAEITLMPDVRLNEDHRQQHKPMHVGSLNLHQGTLTALLSMPQDALDTVMQMLTTDRFKYFIMTGDPLRYRQGIVKSYRLERELNKDDWLTDEG